MKKLSNNKLIAIALFVFALISAWACSDATACIFFIFVSICIWRTKRDITNWSDWL